MKRTFWSEGYTLSLVKGRRRTSILTGPGLSMDDRLYYPCRVQFGGAAVFVVWYTDSLDGFVRDDAGRLLTALTLDGLETRAGTRGIRLAVAEQADYDFDRIRAWCAAPDAAGVDCPAFLNAWNFLDDLAGLHGGADTPYTRLSRGAASCYERLFWGCNLPAVTPPGKRFDPTWSASELDEIRRVLEAGLDALGSELRAAPGAPSA